MIYQDQKGAWVFGAKIADQKYGPPLVGTADTISAIDKPIKVVMKVTIIQP